MLERTFRLSERRSDIRTEVFAGAVTATCIGAALATLIMATNSNCPFAPAPAMGVFSWPDRLVHPWDGLF